jgi:hypothetical protein
MMTKIGAEVALQAARAVVQQALKNVALQVPALVVTGLADRVAADNLKCFH